MTTKATKHDTTKPPMALIPWAGQIHQAWAMANGQSKYDTHNYLQGGLTSIQLMSACLRHSNAYLAGEDRAKDSGVKHLGHAMACLGMLLELEARGLLIDDRFQPQPTLPEAEGVEAILRILKANEALKAEKQSAYDTVCEDIQRNIEEHGKQRLVVNESLKFEVGRKYLTRGGRIATVEGILTGLNWSIYYRDDLGSSFLVDKAGFLFDSSSPSEYDLVDYAYDYVWEIHFVPDLAANGDMPFRGSFREGPFETKVQASDAYMKSSRRQSKFQDCVVRVKRSQTNGTSQYPRPLSGVAATSSSSGTENT